MALGHGFACPVSPVPEVLICMVSCSKSGGLSDVRSVPFHIRPTVRVSLLLGPMTGSS